MGLFDKLKENFGAVKAGDDWAGQAAATSQLAAEQLRDAGYTDGSMVTMANAVDVSSQMQADREVLTAYGQELNRISAIGQPGTGTIVSLVDTGERVAGNPWYQIEIDVMLPGRGIYRASKREMIAPQFLANYSTGAIFNVKVDPANDQKIAFAG